MAILNVFVNNLLPILLLSGAGFALGKILSVDSRPLGRVTFYILSPLLIFNLLITSKLSLDKVSIMMGFSLAVMLSLGGIAYLAGRLLQLDRASLTVVVLTSMFANNGNYGLPLISFAFGPEALAYASIYFVTCSMLAYTVGVLISSLGRLNLADAALGLLKVPAIYAIIIAMVFIQTGWSLPTSLQRAVSLAAGGAIPVMLILLGLELQRAEWTRNLRALSVSTVMRLLVGPVIGLGMSALFGLKGPTRQAGITEAGMPAAVLNTILATEYELEPSLVTAIVFVSTILSPLTLTPLLYFLGK